ncbi:Hpt domain-containing protein [Adlercreutzia murintestinalis]|uniref:Hpt domain-containing protein n=1 Tax=Adlercreutzia murintestinalis TaxID=2941325 RepID=UPI00203AF4C1|nr:Hpt domain-containing protein [Adlercreutzia murintestinalis]
MDDTLTVQKIDRDALTSKLASYGIDYADAMDRMDGNADLYKKLALKYLDNECMADLQAAMEAADYDAAYKAAHTLKGASGNLSFKDLFEASSVESAELFQGEYQAAATTLPQVVATHQKVIEGLEAWQNGTW